MDKKQKRTKTQFRQPLRSSSIGTETLARLEVNLLHVVLRASAGMVVSGLFWMVGPGNLPLVSAQTSRGIPAESLPNPIFPSAPEPQSPQLLESNPDPLQILPLSPTPREEDPQVGEPTVVVERFQFVGNTLFAEEELAAAIAEYTNRPITFSELEQAADRITDLYLQRGYVTSGGYIPANQRLAGGVGEVTMRIVEGRLEDEIQVIGTERLHPSYVQSRLGNPANPLDLNRLEEQVRLLQADPLIENVSAELSAGTQPGMSALKIRVTEASPLLGSQVTLDNNRNPSVGSFRQQGQFNYANLLGRGDVLSAGYARSDGSNDWDVSYSLPINASNGTLSFRYSNTNSDIIEPPFDELEIESSSRSYELSFRQPAIRTASKEKIEEFALGVTVARRESDSQLFGEGFPISLGANEDGETRISVLRVFQEFSQRRPRQVFAARSQFSLGMGAFDATVDDRDPDSQFLAWRAQVLYLRRLSDSVGSIPAGVTLLLRSDVQLATDSLLSLERFGIGGGQSVRGYRQDVLLTDSGAFASAEVRLPILQVSRVSGTLEVAPFVDVGMGWNHSGENPDTNTLVGVGMGLRWQMGDRFTARVDYGVPLVELDSGDRTWQENGLYFSMQYNPF